MKLYVDESSLRKWTDEEVVVTAEKMRTEYSDAWKELNEIDKDSGDYTHIQAIRVQWKMIYDLYPDCNPSELTRLHALVSRYRINYSK